MSIGGNIKRIRTEHGLDQIEFGKIAGVSDKAVSTWENDVSVPRMGAIQKIADYFGIKKSDIIEDSESTLNYGGSNTKSITVDDFTYALFNEAKDLTDTQKAALLAMARALKENK